MYSPNMRNEYHIITWQAAPRKSKTNWQKGLAEVKHDTESRYIPHLRAWLTTTATVDLMERFFGASSTGISRNSLIVESIRSGSREDCLSWAETQR